MTFGTTLVYTPEQKGATEQENRTIVESARSVLHCSGFPERTVGFGLQCCGIHTQPYWTYTNGRYDAFGTVGWSMQLVVTCVFWGQNVTCTFLNRKGTSGTQRVRWVAWSVIWVKSTANEFWMPNERKTVLSLDVLFKPEVQFAQRHQPKPKAHVPHST